MPSFKKTFPLLKYSLFILLLTAASLQTISQDNHYKIFALKSALLKFKLPLAYGAVGSNSKDSIQVYYMIYLLKGNNGRTVLADAGFSETPAMYSMSNFNYTRPDSILEKINIHPAGITDIIITRPHWDHIGCIDLFPNAMAWMQEKDFNYFLGTAWQKEGDAGAFNPKDVQKIIQKNLTGKLTLVKGDNIEIIPGIKVFIGSKHTYESQYALVGSGDSAAIIASDNTWFYYNLVNLLPIPVTFDAKAYVQNLKRMKTMVRNPDYSIPGHDPLVFLKFPAVAEDVVKIKD